MELSINRLIIRNENFSEQEKQEIRSVYSSYGKDLLYIYFDKKKILPFAAKTFIELDIDSKFWSSILEKYRERNKKIIFFLDEAYYLLKSYGVKKIFISENFGALLSSDVDIGLFASGDVDNCYSPEEKPKIYSAFKNLGCTYKENYSFKRLNGTSFYVPSKYGLTEGFYIGFQPLPLSRLKLPSLVDFDDFECWNNTYFYKNTNIQLPNPTALMYICLLHISIHSFSRAPDIRLYCDLINMSKTNVDYEKIISWCNRNLTKTRISVASSLSNTLMNTNFPDSIINQTKHLSTVIKLVYDSNKKDLIYEPNALKVLNIEINCDDKGFFHGLYKIAFPDKNWIEQTYGCISLNSYFKHFKRLI